LEGWGLSLFSGTEESNRSCLSNTEINQKYVDLHLHVGYHWHSTHAQDEIQAPDNDIKCTWFYSTAISTAHTGFGFKWLVNNGVERMWKEVLVVWSQVVTIFSENCWENPLNVWVRSADLHGPWRLQCQPSRELVARGRRSV
jgi:hypothetical protein